MIDFFLMLESSNIHMYTFQAQTIFILTICSKIIYFESIQLTGYFGTPLFSRSKEMVRLISSLWCSQQQIPDNWLYGIFALEKLGRILSPQTLDIWMSKQTNNKFRVTDSLEIFLKISITTKMKKFNNEDF